MNGMRGAVALGGGMDQGWTDGKGRGQYMWSRGIWRTDGEDREREWMNGDVGLFFYATAEELMH